MDVFGVVATEQESYLRDAVLRAAADLRLADALPATAAGAARKLGLPASRRLRRLLDALALFGLARRDGEVFHAMFHAPSGPVPDGGWGRLAEVIRTDRPIPEPAVSGSGAEDALRRFHGYLFETGAAPARELWAALDSEGPTWDRAVGPKEQAIGPLLDLGGGAGAFSAAFPGEATLADTPEVLALAQAPRAVRLPIDLLNTAYPAGQGVVLLANVLHLFGESDCRTLLRKASGALKPGGCVVVKDLLMQPDRSAPGESVLFALNMALFTEAGDVHDPQAVENWLRDAGLTQIRRLLLTTSPGSLVLVAAKP